MSGNPMVPVLRVSEFLVLAWCAIALVVSTVRPLPSPQRMRVITGCLALGAVVRMAAGLPPEGVGAAVRNLLPALYVVASYRIAGFFFLAPDERLERWLIDSDRRLLGRLHPEHWLRGQPWLLGLLEVAYFAVYAMLPVGAWAAWSSGGAAAVDRYWAVVFPAEAICYLALAWLQSRPPRALEAWTDALRGHSPVRGVNEFVLARASHQMNTIPSGHAAGAVSMALALAWLDAPWAAAFAALAGAICVATVVGRYHFLVDTVSGALVAVAWWLVVRAW